MSRLEVGGEPVRTTCELVPTSEKVLTVLNNSPPVRLCVDVDKHKSQRERNKRNHNISISTMQKIYISFAICFLRLFIKIQRCHRWYLRLVSWVPPETFQFVTFTSNDNKDAEYTCFCFKKHVK